MEELLLITTTDTEYALCEGIQTDWYNNMVSKISNSKNYSYDSMNPITLARKALCFQSAFLHTLSVISASAGRCISML